MGCASCKPTKNNPVARNTNVITYPIRRDVLSLYNNTRLNGGRPNNTHRDNTRVTPPKVRVYHNNSSSTSEEESRNVLLYWNSARKTECYHWWPLLNQNSEEEDPVNNLFARGGGIHKYAILCDNLALDYQKTYHSIAADSDRGDKNWAGFCDRAASLSCLFSYPRKPVTVKFGPRQMDFLPQDIEALMICASENAIRKGKTVFYGNRNNTKKKDGQKMERHRHRLIKSEPLPLDLLDILKSLTSELIPFVMDVDNGDAVWNYPFDGVIVKKEPKEKHKDNLPARGRNELYRFILTSTAYPQKNMDLVGYVNTFHNFIDQGWIGDKNPDFLWRQYAQDGPWKGKSEMNPFIDCYHVYRIYQQSLCEENKIVKLTP